MSRTLVGTQGVSRTQCVAVGALLVLCVAIASSCGSSRTSSKPTSTSSKPIGQALSDKKGYGPFVCEERGRIDLAGSSEQAYYCQPKTDNKPEVNRTLGGCWVYKDGELYDVSDRKQEIQTPDGQPADCGGVQAVITESLATTYADVRKTYRSWSTAMKHPGRYDAIAKATNDAWMAARNYAATSEPCRLAIKRYANAMGDHFVGFGSLTGPGGKSYDRYVTRRLRRAIADVKFSCP